MQSSDDANMKKTFLLFAVGLALLESSFSLSCIECNLDLCEDPGSCPYGKTVDVCYCCPACLKGPGEECGGPWNIAGKCGNQLTCVGRLGDIVNPDDINFIYGRCIASPNEEKVEETSF